MKFPLADPPFPQLALTPEQCEAYERLTTAALLETVAEYETFTLKHKRAMNKKQWKAVKSRESVTVYRKRDGDEPAESSSGSSSAVVKLVAVGTIVGNFDDVMYGVVAPASECVKIRSTYVEDDVLDDMMLQQIQYATLEDPYKFLGVKWMVKSSSGVGAWPRDFVFVEATGTHELASGERIGYQVQQSVEIQDCHYLKDQGILRASVASCSLYRQLPNGTVDVYIKSLIEPSGSLPERMAVSAAAAEMIDCSKAIWCAQNKKLSWLMRDAAVKTRMHNRQRGRDEFGDYVGTMKTDAKGKHCCALCAQKFSAFRTAVTCELCKTIVCSRCKTARKLTYVHGGTKVTKIPTAFCKNCVTNANGMNSIEFARSEYAPQDMFPNHTTRQSPAPSVASAASSGRRRQLTATSRSETSSGCGLRKQASASEDWRQLSLADTEGSSLPAWSMDGSEESELSFSRDSVEIDAMDDERYHRRPPTTHEQWETKGQMIVLKQPHSGAPMPIQENTYYPHHQQQQHHAIQQHAYQQQQQYQKPTQQEEMWMQMNQLRLQAENAYRLTRQNNQALGESRVARPQW